MAADDNRLRMELQIQELAKIARNMKVLMKSTAEFFTASHRHGEGDAKRMEELKVQTEQRIEKLTEMFRHSPDRTTPPATQQLVPPTNPKMIPPVSASMETEIPNLASIAIGVFRVESKERESGSSTSLILLQASDKQSSSWSADMGGNTKLLKAIPFKDSEIPNWTGLEIQLEPLKVISCFPKNLVEKESKEVGGLDGVLDNGVGMENASKVFEEMPSRMKMVFSALVDRNISMGDELVLSVVDGMSSSWPAVFDPGGGNNHGWPNDVWEIDNINGIYGPILDEQLVVEEPKVEQSFWDQNFESQNHTKWSDFIAL